MAVVVACSRSIITADMSEGHVVSPSADSVVLLRRGRREDTGVVAGSLGAFEEMSTVTCQHTVTNQITTKTGTRKRSSHMPDYISHLICLSSFRICATGLAKWP